MKQRNPVDNIYINEHLTDHRKNVFFSTRKLFKKKNIFATWSQKGNILVRKTEDDRPVEIRSHQDLLQFNPLYDEERSASLTRQDLQSHLSDYSY